MSRNPYSNLSHEELLKLLAEKDAQLEKSSTEIRTLREEKQVQKELMAQETERLQGKVYDLEQKNRQMTVKLAQMGLAVNEVLPVLQSFFDDLKLRDAFDPQDPEFEGTIRRIVDGYYKGFKAAATMVTYFCAGNESQKVSKKRMKELNQILQKYETKFEELRNTKEKWFVLRDLLRDAAAEAEGPLAELLRATFEHVAAAVFPEEQPEQRETVPEAAASETPAGTEPHAEAEAQAVAVAAAPSSLKSEVGNTLTEPVATEGTPEVPKKYRPTGRKFNKSELPLEEILEDPRRYAWLPKIVELLGRRTIDVHEMVALLNDFMGRFRQEIALYVDEHGKVYSNLHADSCVGVTPRSSVGMRLIVNMAWTLYHGLSLTRSERMFAEACCFGNETILKNLQHFSDYVLDPLIERMCGVLGNSAYVGCDETTWNVLEIQGRGVCKATEDPKSQNWILSMCNFGAEIPVSLFLRLDSRSAESMNKAINGAFGEDGFNPKYLVVDGYPGYPALIRKREGNWSRSLCLAHLRRYLCEALGFSSWEKARNSKTLGEMKQSFVTRLENSDPKMCLLASLEVIRRIFELDAKTMRRSKSLGLSDEEHLRELARVRNEHSRTLMQDLDKMVMQYLQPTYAKRNGKQADGSAEGQVWVNAQGKNATGAFVVYYLNNRADFWTFLEDPNIPLSTNEVERQIRTVALARNGSPHMQSAKSMDVICKIFSVFETAKRCGVADPLAWLDRFAHYQYAHWIEARAQHDLDTGAGKDFNKAYADWDLAELSYGPHIDQFLPWNCSNGVPEWRKLKAPDTPSET